MVGFEFPKYLVLDSESNTFLYRIVSNFDSLRNFEYSKWAFYTSAPSWNENEAIFLLAWFVHPDQARAHAKANFVYRPAHRSSQCCCKQYESSTGTVMARAQFFFHLNQIIINIIIMPQCCVGECKNAEVNFTCFYFTLILFI